jgi:hypothetical protein
LAPFFVHAIALGFAPKICAHQCKSAAEKGFPLRSSVVRLRLPLQFLVLLGLFGEHEGFCPRLSFFMLKKAKAKGNVG